MKETWQESKNSVQGKKKAYFDNLFILLQHDKGKKVLQV